MNLKKLGWNVAKIGVGVGASVFGGPGAGMLAAAGMEGLHTAASSDRRKEWKKDPLKNAITTGVSVGAAGLAGTDAVKGALGIGKITNGGEVVGIGTGEIAKTGATTISKDAARVTLSEGAKNAGGASVDVATNTASKALSDVSKNVTTKTVGKTAEEGLKETGKSALTKWDKISKGANIASLGVNTYMNLKGLEDLNNMETPKIGSVPMAKPNEVVDTVSSTAAAGQESIDIALANKRKIDEATGRSDSSEDAVLAMTAGNQISANVEQTRVSRDAAKRDEQFRADSVNQSTAAQLAMSQAQMDANFTGMKTQMASEMTSNLIAAPMQFIQSSLNSNKSYWDQYNSVLSAIGSATSESQKKELLARKAEYENILGITSKK